jgi:peptidoglycan/LPS O-acetylase OafA/YrhL
MPGVAGRLAFVDALKALAFQLIVLHHLAFYGPMSDHAYALAPVLMTWLSQDARMAVQAFLVIAGFLAARSIAPSGAMLSNEPVVLLQQRYLKLVTPFLAAVLIGIACAAIARELMVHDSIPGRPTLPQILAHALLLQGILGYEGLSAGVWYVAIDFQLFALLVATLWLARGIAQSGAATAVIGASLVASLAVASLYYFNRDSGWDNWGVYFFGSYALGVAGYWATNRRRPLAWLLPMVGVVISALLFDYRPRIAVALLVALALCLARMLGFLENWPRSRALAYLGQISYSVFLIHFPICLLISGTFSRFAGSDPWINLTGMLVAWLASIAAGALFYQLVESPVQRFFRGARSASGVRQMP